jgi:hypothetical protein
MNGMVAVTEGGRPVQPAGSVVVEIVGSISIDTFERVLIPSRSLFEQ